MDKNDSVRIKISSDKKQLWKDYCEAYGYRLNLSKLIEFAVDDRVTGRTRYKNNSIGAGLYWLVAPTGKERDTYDRGVLSDGGREIEKLKGRRDRLRNEI